MCLEAAEYHGLIVTPTKKAAKAETFQLQQQMSYKSHQLNSISLPLPPVQLSKALEQQAKELRERAVQQLEATVAAHTAELIRLRAQLTEEHAAGVGRLVSAHGEELERSKQQHDQQMQQVLEQHRMEIIQFHAAASTSRKDNETALRCDLVVAVRLLCYAVVSDLLWYLFSTCWLSTLVHEAYHRALQRSHLDCSDNSLHLHGPRQCSCCILTAAVCVAASCVLLGLTQLA